jgi:hypothetical protein
MSASPSLPAVWLDPPIAAQIVLIAQSYQQILGQPLLAKIPHDVPDLIRALWSARQVIVAHGNQADPLFFFGNAAALRAFECDAASFTQMPSRLSAELALREERQSLLDRVSLHGFIRDYAGIRISALGRRFAIAHAHVWNLIDANGTNHGQAACFIAPNHGQ